MYKVVDLFIIVKRENSFLLDNTVHWPQINKWLYNFVYYTHNNQPYHKFFSYL